MNQSNENISRIRELVLGNNIAEIENRFLKLDQQFSFLLDESEQKWKKLFDELDKKTSSELQNALKDIKTESQHQFEHLNHELQGNQKMIHSLTDTVEVLTQLENFGL